MVEAGGEPTGLVNGHPVVQRRLLRHDADAVTQFDGIVDGMPAEHADRSGVGTDGAQHGLNRRRFAGPVVAQQGEHDTGGNAPGDVVDGPGLAERFGDGRELDHSRRGSLTHHWASELGVAGSVSANTGSGASRSACSIRSRISSTDSPLLRASAIACRIRSPINATRSLRQRSDAFFFTANPVPRMVSKTPSLWSWL